MAASSRVLTPQQHILGVSLVILVAIIWVASSELIQFIFTSGAAYEKPYVLTYFSTSLFSIYLLAFLHPNWRARLRDPPLYITPQDEVIPPATDLEEGPERWSVRQTAMIGAALAPIFFTSNWVYNLGLALTSIASSTTIATLSGLFTLLLGAMAGVERFSFAKLIAATLTIIGVAVISKYDSDSEQKNSFAGDIVSVFAAFLYSCYTTALKKRAGPPGALDTAMMFGFLGVAVFVMAWPGILLFHVAGWETFEWPSLRVIGLLCLNALVGTVLSDFLWAKSVVLTTPLIGTLALSLCVPFSLFVEYVFRGFRFTLVYFLGVLAVFSGFIIVNIDEVAASRRAATLDEIELDEHVEERDPLGNSGIF